MASHSIGKEISSQSWILFHFTDVVAIAVIVVSFIGVSGCAPETRHEVLTFFFTGVPEPGSELAEEDKAIEVRADEARVKRKKRRIFYQEPKFYIHGPFAARECDKCHSADSAKQFQIGGAKATKEFTSKRKRFGPRLAYPLTKLCITCHNDKGDIFASSMKLSIHEPVANGMCVKCHDPHKSARQYMLRGKNSIELCSTTCHAKDNFVKTEVHRKQKDKDCLECHNPHLGKTAQLLRSDFNEWQQFNGGN